MCDAMVVDLIVNAVLIFVIKELVDSVVENMEEKNDCSCRRQYARSYVTVQMRIIYISGARRIHQVKNKQRAKHR